MSDGSDGSYLVKSSLGVYPGCRTYNKDGRLPQ